ncbi:DUF805 domain-containing protein [Acinetobacter rathckeae]|uniref:DUF805 domain-containing protein n=1 Tax=Acinetobacter rathckeae TaxID=2605272 RepID=UPI0018A321F3|nr:DUF805 domain-containing protein [Acinetobacter rathckeae]MBF7688612.1 DUF805 domain-containing protein [Acinetobacter rathckeae]
MKGTVLDFSVQSNKGIITLDEKRYHFTGDQWKEQLHPKRGQQVDFEVDEQTGNAINIYFVVMPSTSTPIKNSQTESNGQTKDTAQAETNKFQAILDEYQKSVMTCFKKYIDIKGRAARSEYWYFQLCATLIMLIMSTANDTLSTIAFVVFITPLITVTVRRLHDINRSGWWVLIAAIPLVGSIVIFYWAISKGSLEENLYGPPPQ